MACGVAFGPGGGRAAPMTILGSRVHILAACVAAALALGGCTAFREQLGVTQEDVTLACAVALATCADPGVAHSDEEKRACTAIAAACGAAVKPAPAADQPA